MEPVNVRTEIDPFKRPVFSVGARLRRLTWRIFYYLVFRPSPTPLHAWRSVVLRAFGAKIGRANHIYPGAKIWAPWLLVTEDVVTIASGAEVYNPGGVYLAHHAIVSQDAYICGASHNYNEFEFAFFSREIRMEPYSWVCARAIVLPGVVLAEGSVLGAGSVATRTLDAWGVYAGNPARLVKWRNRFDTTATLIDGKGT